MGIGIPWGWGEAPVGMGGSALLADCVLWGSQPLVLADHPCTPAPGPPPPITAPGTTSCPPPPPSFPTQLPRGLDPPVPPLPLPLPQLPLRTPIPVVAPPLWACPTPRGLLVHHGCTAGFRGQGGGPLLVVVHRG